MFSASSCAPHRGQQSPVFWPKVIALLIAFSALLLFIHSIPDQELNSPVRISVPTALSALHPKPSSLTPTPPHFISAAASPHLRHPARRSRKPVPNPSPSNSSSSSSSSSSSRSSIDALRFSPPPSRPCRAGFVGPECQYSKRLTCNNRGVPSYEGQCQCNRGYAGAQCELSDERDCHGHGSVNHAGKCECDSIWLPPDCSDRKPGR